jgi:hypothetical protein
VRNSGEAFNLSAPALGVYPAPCEAFAHALALEKLQNVMPITAAASWFWQITDHQWGGFGPEHDQRMAMKIALRPTWKGNLLMLVVALIVLFAVAS